MKSFKEYLAESKQSYTFRVKMAHEPTDEQIEKIERHLIKYDIEGMSAPKKLMLQSAPYDFPQLRGYEIYVIEFKTARTVSAYQIGIELQSLLGLGDGMMKVRSDEEPLEKAEQNSLDDKKDDEQKAILGDDDYSEAEKIDGTEYYGDKYNTTFVQELLKLRKDKEKETSGKQINE